MDLFALTIMASVSYVILGLLVSLTTLLLLLIHRYISINLSCASSRLEWFDYWKEAGGARMAASADLLRLFSHNGVQDTQMKLVTVLNYTEVKIHKSKLQRAVTGCGWE